jgi:hypothetical protein
MVNASELSINVVKDNELKKLTSSNQNGTRLDTSLSCRSTRTTQRTAERQDLTQSVIGSERGKPDTSP